MPALRYFAHLIAPGWNFMGGGEPPFAGVDAGHNENMAWGFTFAGTDMVDLYVEELPPDDNQVRWQDGYEPLRTITEQITVKGEAAAHGRAQVQPPRAGLLRGHAEPEGLRGALGEPGAGNRPLQGQLQARAGHELRGLLRSRHVLEGADAQPDLRGQKGNIAFQLSGLTPDRDGWNGRLPVPGTGQYEWKGFRSDLPREMNPERGYITTANDNSHPKDYKGRPVMYHSTAGVATARITRLHQILCSGQGSASRTTSASSTTPIRCRPSSTCRSSRGGRRRTRTSRGRAR